MSHLGDRLVALIDGELDHDTRDKVLAHLAVCGECRAEADAQRRLKGMVSDLDGPEPSADLLERLRTLAEPGEPTSPAPPVAPLTGSEGSTGGTRPAGFDSRFTPRFLGAFAARAARSAAATAPQRPGPRRASLTAAGVCCLVAVVGTTAFVAGDRGTGGVRMIPPVDRYAVQHAVTTSPGSLTDPAAGSVVAPVSGATCP